MNAVPLVAAAVMAYTAGLLAGFNALPLAMLAAAALTIHFGAGRHRDRLALAALCAAGIALGHSGRAGAQRCAERLLKTGAAQVRLHAAAAPGAFVGGEARCGTRVHMAITSGRAADGSTVHVRGNAIASRPGGRILITNATVQPRDAPGLLTRWRAAIGRGIDARFAERAPLVRALLIADMRDLSPAVRERFASSGLSHMLSVSGLHVGLIAVAVSLVARIAGLQRRRADALVIALTTLYVAVIGAPLPAVRAAAMLAVVSTSVAAQRPTSAWAALAVSAIGPLLDPASATDLGFQLSMAGMVALVASGVLSKRLPWLRAPGWRGALLRGLATSTMATLLTAPLVAATFGRISLVAPVTNVVASPIMAVLQPMLFLVVLLLPLGPAAQFVADATYPLIAAIDRVAVAGAALPGSAVPVVADDVAMLLCYASTVAFVLACVVRAPIRLLMVATGCIGLLAWRPLLPARGGWAEVHMIDVGQGDAIALRTSQGRWVLFDAGRVWKSGDAGRRDVVPYLARRGGALAGFILSHPHSDHVGGAASVIQALRPAWYVDPGYAGGTASYRASLVAAREARTAWRRVSPGDSVRVDDAMITFLAPDPAWADSLRDPNDASTVARVRVGDVTFLLAGDAERDEEEWLLRHQSALLDVDVLKVAHHGSATSSTRAFLQAVTPRLALVSVGAGNVYRHPSDDVVRSLAAHGAVVMRTDRHGSIIVRTDGTVVEVEAAGERWIVR